MKKIFLILALIFACVADAYSQYYLYGWGFNKYGQIGNSQNIDQVTPILIDSFLRWKQIAVGDAHSVAIRSDGTLWTWGWNYDGQLGDGTLNDSNIPMQIGTDTNWAYVACGQYFTLALKSNGSLWGWGKNMYNELGNGTAAPSNIPIQIGSDTNWATLSCGTDHTIAIKSDGTLWAWGANWFGQIGDSTTDNDRRTPVQIGKDSDWADVRCGYYHNVAIKKDSTLWTWGYNRYGELGDGTAVYIRNYPVQIEPASVWKSFSCGSNHTVAIKGDGTLWAWGANWFGQIGDNSDTNRFVPIKIDSSKSWSSTNCGVRHSAAINNDGSLWTWGGNSSGQLGDGTNTSKSIPIRMGRNSAWTSVICGGWHTLALTSAIFAPVLMLPSNLDNSVSINPILVWEKLGNATIYRVQLSTANDFATTLLNEEVSDTSKIVIGVSSVTKYYWRVQAINGNQASQWSDVWSFTTEDPASIAESNNFSFSISPQSVRDEAEITFDAANVGIVTGISIELYDLKGTLVATYNFASLSEGSNMLRLDVHNLVSGMYNVIIKSGTEIHQAKMIKVE